jgi:diguanylate cyclase (GGDEF)-like protein/PAS domain S-box-containing protein
MLLRSIRSRLLALVLATAMPFLVLVGVGLVSQWREDQAEASQRTLSEARLLAAQLDDYIGNIENLMAGLARAVSTDPADAAANDALLAQVRSKLPGFVGSLVLYSLDGVLIGTSSERKSNRPDIPSHKFFQDVVQTRRLSVGEVFRTEHSGRWLLVLGYPVEDKDGHLRAVIATGTQLEHFQSAFRTGGLPAGSIVRIINEHGTVILQSDNRPHAIGSDLSHVGRVAEDLRVKESVGVAVWSDHVRRITGSSTAHKVPWLVSVGLPTDVAFAALAQRLRWGTLVSLGAILVAFAIAWMLSGRIVRPLLQLGKDAEILAAGKLDHRTPLSTGDEVGKLADAFNRMANSLERRQYEVQQSNDTLSAVIDASPVAIVCSDLNRRIMLWSRAAQQLYGYTARQAIGTPIKIVPPEESAASLALYQRARSGESIRDIESKRRRQDGSLVDVRIAAAPMYNPDGTVRGVAWAHEDITERKRAEEQLRRLAHYDPLTGLPNRLSLQEALRKLLAVGQRPTAVALFDLDGFKDVNDTLGHSVGDRLLIEVGRRLVESTEPRGERNQVFRLGGDEFVVVVPDCGDPRVVGQTVDAMLRRLGEPFRINEQALHLGGSAGIAIAPNDGATVDELIANADLALYQAKSNGGRSYRLFVPVLRAQAQARRALDVDLRRAFAENELELYYQPEVRLADGAAVGAEALLRWRHPERGVLAPWAFIDTLADSAIAADVGRWIIHAACRQVAEWRAMGLPLGRIGVNLFPAQLQGDALSNDIDDALRQTGLPGEAIELEITENIALNYADAIEQLQRLSERGVKLTFDDFGTGYASLSYLTRFPLARIKIDRSFVHNITDDAQHAAIVRSLIAMAHNLGLEVIAEGVETQAQATFLLQQHCEEAQGYLYAKPLPAAEFADYLRMSRLDVSASAPCARPRARDAASAAEQSPRRRKIPRV